MPEVDGFKATGRVWLKSRDVIAMALKDMMPSQRDDWHEHNAAAIIARLANHNLLICTPEEMKGE